MNNRIKCSEVVASCFACGISVSIERSYDSRTKELIKANGVPDTFCDYLVFVSQDDKSETRLYANEWTPGGMRKLGQFLIEQAAALEKRD